MGLSVALIAALAWLDDRREAEAALEDFSQEQATLATSVGGQLRSHLLLLERELESPTPRGSEELDVIARHVRLDAITRPARDGVVDLRLRDTPEAHEATDVALSIGPLLHEAARVAHPGESLVLVLPPGSSALLSAGPRRVDEPALAAALTSGASTLRLERKQAAALGLPARTAVAGLSLVDAGRFGRWGVAVVTSASRERDRQRRASLRLVLGVTLAGGLVFVFGAIALAKQRRELELARALELAAAARAHDERLVRADRVAVMGTLATGVAHEISTPLGVIAGRAEQLLASLEKSGLDPRGKKHLEVIQEQTARIAGTIRGFMDLARGGAPVLTTAAPAQICRAAVRLAEHRFVASGVSLHTDVAPALPEIHCDHRLLEHALVNLLLNACAACERGGHVELAVRAAAAGERHPVACIEFVVDDDGVGITTEAAARATEPFFTTKPVGEGTGLGLAITHEIVQAHHGTLTIAPRAAGGTRAAISIPIGTRSGEPEPPS
jgi:signal transduction histidine kinase